MTTFHVYPHLDYGYARTDDLGFMLQAIEDSDRSSTIENLVTNSHLMSEYLEGIYGRRADLVAHPGINLPADPQGPADNKTALFVGRFWSHKRIELILDALALLPEGNVVLVGEGPEGKALAEQTRRLGLESRVRFAGNLGVAELDALFRNVTCGIYTPFREPFGIMPLEAASHGLPVVITPDGGYAEALDPSCAHIVPAQPRRIANALNSLFTDHSRAREMGRLARERAKSFTWDHTAAKLLELFKKKLNHPPLHLVREAPRPLIGAHYYPWYGADEPVRHWNENSEYANVDDLPELGAYSSDDPALISHHLELTAQAGLDYLVINLQISPSGLDPHEIRAADRLFEQTAQEQPDLSLCFMMTFDGADSAAIESALVQVEDNFLARPNYLHVKGAPALWFFITEAFLGHFFYRFSRFSDATARYHRIASAAFGFSDVLPRHFVKFFDGWSIYSPLQISEPEGWEKAWKASYVNFNRKNASEERVGSRVFCISPGYDDTGLTNHVRESADYREIPREDLLTYERMQAACLGQAALPELIVITSFNEFHENSHIEPSRNLGSAYIEGTRKFSDELRGPRGPTRQTFFPPSLKERV